MIKILKFLANRPCRREGTCIPQKFGHVNQWSASSFSSLDSARMSWGVGALFILLMATSQFVGCVTGRWVQEGKTEEDIQRDQQECETLITEEEGGEILPEQYTSTRFWEREPPLKPSQESFMARAMRLCMESKGYKFFRK